MAGRPCIGALIAAALVAGCSRSSSPAQPAPVPAPSPAAPVRVLMLTATAGFRHDSIPTARTVVAALAARGGEFTVAATENLADVSAARLSSVDVLMFALTSGELALDASQKAAITGFVEQAAASSASTAPPTRSTNGPTTAASSAPTSKSIPG